MATKFRYNHKDVKLPEDIDSIYLGRAFTAFERLKDVYDGITPYIPDDYYILVLTFERFYKGVYIELLKTDDPELDENKTAQELTGSNHYFNSILVKIKNFIPIAANKEGEDVVLKNCYEIQKRGTAARFSTEFTVEEFRSDFRRLETSMARITKGLEDYLEKVKHEAMDEDLEYW